MTATKHSTEVFLVADPEQGYEETLTIYGVYGSARAAQMAAHRLRRKLLGPYDQHRNTEVQHWRGDQHLGTWTYHGHPDSAACCTWTYEEHPT